MSKRMRYRFSATGRNTFPFDMLRYDSCHPNTQDSVSEMEASLDPNERIAREQRGFKVTLTSYVRPCEPARWNSFGWRISEERREPL
jgi:hypothetical protein